MSCENCRTKIRSQEEIKKLVNRINRIEGQIRGIKRMVEENAYCTDIFIQVSATAAALNSFNKELLESHINTCVIKDIKEGNEESVKELTELLKKLI